MGLISTPNRAALAGALLMAAFFGPGAALSQSYTYDALGRVTQVVSDHSTATHAYDAADNRSAYTSVTGQNHAPVAVADTLAAAVNTAVTFNPRTNDTDVDNDPLTITGATTPAHGTTSFVAGSVTYTPASSYSGSDSFSYTVSDGYGGTSSATVSVTVS